MSLIPRIVQPFEVCQHSQLGQYCPSSPKKGEQFPQDSRVLHSVDLALEFVSEPMQICRPSESVLSSDMAAICDEEVGSILLKPAIYPARKSASVFSTIF